MKKTLRILRLFIAILVVFSAVGCTNSVTSSRFEIEIEVEKQEDFKQHILFFRVRSNHLAVGLIANPFFDITTCDAFNPGIFFANKEVSYIAIYENIPGEKIFLAFSYDEKPRITYRQNLSFTRADCAKEEIEQSEE